MKEGKERILYDNYDLWDIYAEDAKEFLMDEHGEEEPTDNAVWDEINFQDSVNWEGVEDDLITFFNQNGNGYILIGTLGLWNGNFAGGFIFDTWDELTDKRNIFKDCGYIKIYDVNGHFYIKCSHHDGTNFYEIKELTANGRASAEKWLWNEKDKRTERELHKSIFTNNSLSRLPHFAHKMYGCKKKEYEQKTA